MRLVASLAASVLSLGACGGPSSGGDEAPGDKAARPLERPVPIRANPNRNAYFGDLHVHTRNSFDAYIFNVRATPDDAYRFAKGETIQHGAGYGIELSGPPLDFLAVTDHGEYLGIIPAMDDPDHPLSKTQTAQLGFGDDLITARNTFLQIGQSFVIGQPIAEINDQDHMNSVWAETVAAAEKHNLPGTFTTFSGYEFTAMRPIDLDSGAAANLHRNVIFKDGAPDQLFTTLDSRNPEDLWAWMNGQRAAGRDALAIPHNSNASNGWMFAEETYVGGPLDAGYIATRRANEPLVEITQIKGTSETHPALSPNDEWAAFEQYEYFIGSNVRATVNNGDFIRKALARGLAIEEERGANPYAFGFIGSSDTHIGAATLDEDKHWGKFTNDGRSAEARASVPPDGAKTWDVHGDTDTGQVLAATQYGASGLAGVWAEENTRASLFAAMQRRETFGTSGPRIRVRFFGGAALSADLLDRADLLDEAYDKGVPMGGELGPDEPGFIAWAMRDAASAPLQRLQIIKVWAEDGALREAVYDAACSGDGVPDPQTHRCPDNGAKVDITTCQTELGTGASELKTYWQDPAFVAGQDAAYYVRVLENPTCRWSTWDAVRNGTPPRPDLPATLQERAWSSPIFVGAGEPAGQ